MELEIQLARTPQLKPRFADLNTTYQKPVLPEAFDQDLLGVFKGILCVSSKMEQRLHRVDVRERIHVSETPTKLCFLDPKSLHPKPD